MAKYSRPRIKRLLLQSDNAPSADAKGAKLEGLICYVFSKLRGVSFHAKNILDANRAHELDVVFWNKQNQSDIYFLDAVIIVECKNTGSPVGSDEVGWFVRKLQDRGANHGILVALSGITGASTGITSAHSEIISALTRDKIKIILIDRDEILGLANTDDLVQLIKDKILKLTLHRTII